MDKDKETIPKILNERLPEHISHRIYQAMGLVTLNPDGAFEIILDLCNFIADELDKVMNELDRARSIALWHKCPVCNGAGRVIRPSLGTAAEISQTCLVCDGKGIIPELTVLESEQWQQSHKVKMDDKDIQTVSPTIYPTVTG